MTQLAATAVASMEATADGRRVECRTYLEEGRYLVRIGDLVVHHSRSVTAAIEQMAHHIDRRLPHPAVWGLRVECGTRNFSIAYGTAKSPGGGGGRPIPCVEEAMESYSDATMDAALRHAVATLKNCCR